MEEILEELGQFTHDLTVDDIPSDVREYAKAKIIDTLACTYLGEEYIVTKLARRTADSAPPGPSTLFVGGGTADPSTATFVNTAAAHAILQDDIDLQAGHPAVVIVPPALAVSETHGRTGPEFLAAVVAAFDVMWRVGGKGVINVRAQELGFRSNTFLGVFGSASAAATLMGREPGEIAKALGIAVSLLSGILEPLNQGTMERTFQHASNARQGVLAALLAEPEFEACPTILEGERGLFHNYGGYTGKVSEGADQYGKVVGNLADGLGTEFRIMEAWSKPFPSAGSHTIALAVLAQLLERRPIALDAVESVDIRVLPRFTGIPGYPMISSKGPIVTIEAALVSFPFQIACYLRYGEINLQVLEAAMSDPGVAEVIQKINLIPTEVPHPLWGEVAIAAKDGETVKETTDDLRWGDFYPDVDHAAAKLARSLEEKAPGLALEIVDSVRALDSSEDSVKGLAAALRKVSDRVAVAGPA